MENYKTSEFHEHRLIAVLLLLWRDFLDQKQCYVEHYDGNKTFCKSTDDGFGGNIACKEGKFVLE